MQRSFFDEECNADLEVKRRVSSPRDTRDDDDKKRGEALRHKILAALRVRPHRSSELVRIFTWRFSSCIGELRNRDGYVIKDEKLDGGDHLWSLGGHDGTVAVTKEMQEAYYETEHWSSIRKMRREFDGHQCAQCHSDGPLEVHHWEYPLFAEKRHHVITLCRECHEMVHANPLIKCHFPRRVSREVASRLGWNPQTGGTSK